MPSEDHGLDWVQNWHVWKVTRDWNAGWVLKFMLHYIYITYYTSILLFTLQPAQNAQPITAAQPRFSGCLFADMARSRCNLATGFPWCWPSPDPSLVKPGSRIGSGHRGHRPCRILQGQSWLWHFLDRPDRKPVVWNFPDFSCQSI